VGIDFGEEGWVWVGCGGGGRDGPRCVARFGNGTVVFGRSKFESSVHKIAEAVGLKLGH
jgi:hypothetical protein